MKGGVRVDLLGPVATGDLGRSAMIVTEGLTRRFGDTVVVDDVSLSIGEGEIFGLLGPNGAGKTTTLRMIAGLIGVTSGRATVDGSDVTDPRAVATVRSIVGVLPEEPGLSGDLTAVATLDFFGRLYGLSRAARAERTEALLHRLGLFDRRDQVVSTYSKGLKQRLALARALVHDPRVVLLDEPTANLDPEAARVVREVLVELAGDGRTVVLNTHRLDEVERLCHRVGVLNTRLMRVGTPSSLRAGAAGLVEVDLERVDAAHLAALEALGVAVTARGHRLEVEVTANRSTADVVAALVGAGARVTGVERSRESLEDAYLSIVGTTS